MADTLEAMTRPSKRSEANAQTLKGLRPDPLEKELVAKCLEERSKGKMAGPVKASALDSGVLLTPRFGIEQNDKVARLRLLCVVRCCVDMSGQAD